MNIETPGAEEADLARLRDGIRARFAPPFESAQTAEFPRSRSFRMLMRHPVLCAAGGGVLLLAIGPLRAFGWAIRIFSVWKLLRSVV